MGKDILDQKMRAQVELLERDLGRPLNDPLSYRFRVRQMPARRRVKHGNFYLYPASDGRKFVLETPIQPFISASDTIRSALIKTSGAVAVDKEGLYPTRDEVSSGKIPIFEKSRRLMTGSDAVLHIQIDGELKIIQLLRDKKAPSFPLHWACPGGVVTESPSVTGIKEFNEEIAIIVSADKDYFLLLLTRGGESGISLREKQGQIETIRSYAAQRYKNFDPARNIKVIALELEEVAYNSWPKVKVEICSGQQVIDRFDSNVTVIPGRSVAVFQRMWKLPVSADSLIPKNLAHGENCFFVNPEFNNDVQAFTPAQHLRINNMGRHMDNFDVAMTAMGLRKSIRPAEQVLLYGYDGPTTYLPA